jgi:hypothetical protein
MVRLLRYAPEKNVDGMKRPAADSRKRKCGDYRNEYERALKHINAVSGHDRPEYAYEGHEQATQSTDACKGQAKSVPRMKLFAHALSRREANW